MLALYDLLTLPDPALRRPFTGAASLPFCLSYYAMAVLVILPRTFILRLSLLPFLLWQAWRCTVGLDFSEGLALYMGVENVGQLDHWNFGYIMNLISMALRSIEWALARKPFRRYEPFTEGQHTPVERPLTVPNVILDAFALVFNQRGIGWSWGPKSSLRTRPPSSSLTAVIVKLLVKLTVFDFAAFIVKGTRPSLVTPPDGTVFDPDLDPLPRAALALYITLFVAITVYTSMDIVYHTATLICRVLLRQPAEEWPAFSARPWLATSIQDFWGFRWHQYYRHTYITYGARPCGALFGRPGAVLGAFGASAVIHYAGLWGVGKGTEFWGAGAFFLFMGVGGVLECVWRRTTGTRVGGFWGWAWTMVWTLSWGTLMMDGWARHGLITGDSFMWKRIVNDITALIANS